MLCNKLAEVSIELEHDLDCLGFGNVDSTLKAVCHALGAEGVAVRDHGVQVDLTAR